MLLVVVALSIGLGEPALEKSRKTGAVARVAADQQASEQKSDGARIVAPPTSFMIAAIDVTGVTKLTSAEIERIVYPFMGPDRAPSDVEAARKAVQDAYTAKGFEATVVEVPPQPAEAFAAGVVEIRVNEAPVANIRVTGSKYHAAERIRRQLPSLTSGEPLNFKRLQTELSHANRFPDREVIPSFDAGEVPGSLDVNLRVRDSFPLHATLELNNDNSVNTSRLRASGSVRYTNLWGIGHTITVGFAVAPENLSESSAIFGSYSAPVLGSPWSFVFSGYKSNSDVATLGGTNVLGNGYQIGAQAIYRLTEARDFHAFRAGLDYKDFKQNIGLAGLTVSRAPIRYVPLTLGYSFSAAREKASLDVDLYTTLGLRVIKSIRCFDPAAIACIPEDQFTNKDVDSRENFAHVNLDLTYTASFPGDWVGMARMSGQYADSHLVANEQFAFGGLTTLRGFFQSEIVGDKGLSGTIEFRSPSLATQLGTFVDELRFFSFADVGIASVIDPLPDQRSTFEVSSLGGGLRLKIFRTFSGEFVVAVPVRSGTDSRRGNERYSFSLKGEF
jgi:hemolysin activation/secretion protein